MEQRTVGTGDVRLAVSQIALGTMMFGTKVDEKTSFAILDRYVEAGGTFVDTANCYQFWDGGVGTESELLLGRWLSSRGNRGEVIVASKVGSRPEGPGEWPANAEGLSAKVIRTQIDESLTRLGIEHLDVYYAHIEDRGVDLSETVEGLNSVVADGKARLLGLSNHQTWRIERARGIARSRGWADLGVIQQRHSYLRPKPYADLGAQRAVTPELLDYVRSEPEITLLAYSPLLSGAYASRPDKPLPPEYRSADNTRRLEVLHEVAKEVGATPGQVVLAWMLGGDPPVIPLIGASSVAQLEESLAASDLELDDEQRRRLDTAGE